MMGKALETLAHNGMRDDVVEFLDVAVSCIEGVEQVGFAIVQDDLCAIVEVGNMGWLVLGTSHLAVGEDVLVQVSVKVLGEIATGRCLNDLVVQLCIDGQGSAGHFEGAIGLLLLFLVCGKFE